MAKLTEAQKALNKAANAARQKAFTARRNEYRAAIEVVEASVKVSDAQRQVQAATAAFEAAFQSRNETVDTLREQIRQLEAQIKAAEQDHGQRLESARDHKNAAWQAYREAEKLAKAPVEEAYADICNCYSPGEWKPLEDFVSEFVSQVSEKS